MSIKNEGKKAGFKGIRLLDDQIVGRDGWI